MLVLVFVRKQHCFTSAVFLYAEVQSLLSPECLRTHYMSMYFSILAYLEVQCTQIDVCVITVCLPLHRGKYDLQRQTLLQRYELTFDEVEFKRLWDREYM
jgi:hypothetical protein